jgi:dipeptidase E
MARLGPPAETHGGRGLTHMPILLGSGGFRTPERIALLQEQMRSFFGSIRRLVFLPYAIADHDAYLKTALERGYDAGYELVGLQTFADPVRAIKEADGIFVGGGNTFRLLDSLYRLKLLDPIRERVGAGMPFLGVSAGCNVACPTIRTTNDMPICEPPSLTALGLVPFQVNPHYYTGSNWVKHGDEFIEHFSETRDDRLREFHEMNNTPVIGLYEPGLLRCESGGVRLIGARARLFRKGEPPVDFESGADLADLLD